MKKRINQNFLQSLFSKNLTYEQISDELKSKCPNQKGFSLPSIKLLL